MKISSYWLLLGLIADIYISSPTRGDCRVTNDPSKKVGYINSRLANGNQVQNCVWTFSENIDKNNDIIVLQIEQMELKYLYRSTTWWCTGELDLQGQNICDFTQGVCFIFSRIYKTCELLSNVTSTCSQTIWVLGNATYPPKLTFKNKGKYYESKHNFRIKYTYVDCNNYITTTRTPVSTTVSVAATSTAADNPTYETGSFNNSTYGSKFETTIPGGTKDRFNQAKEANYITLVIVLGCFCGILTVLLMYTTVRLIKYRSASGANEGNSINENEVAGAEDLQEMPVYSTVNNILTQLKKSDERIMVDNQLYSSL
uniref:uncharacterized protein LOC120334354 isoform X2 n=1 Tax=Styela clava TaxID=7725 RepID=UPI00193A1424|nr:uncharacterized protein LOC120334354 isoform X2 [Styela clava]